MYNIEEKLVSRCTGLETLHLRQNHRLCEDDIKYHQKSWNILQKMREMKEPLKILESGCDWFPTQSHIFGTSQSFRPLWFLPSKRGLYWISPSKRGLYWILPFWKWRKTRMENWSCPGGKRDGGKNSSCCKIFKIFKIFQFFRKIQNVQVEKEMEERMAAAAAAEEGGEDSSSIPQKVTKVSLKILFSHKLRMRWQNDNDGLL